MKKIIIALFIFSLAAGSCRRATKATDNRERPVRQFEIEEVWRTDTLLMTPESVIYDREREIFYISNVNFEPRKKDGNGFISRMDKDGTITDLKWIEGLSSPKGLALAGDTLFTADVDEIVVMDVSRGIIVRTIPVEGAGMLNDITTDPEGNLYISDTDANIIHRYSKGKLTVWYDIDLKGPNGLLWNNGRLLVASQGSNDFTAIDVTTKERAFITDGINRGDGIAWTGIPGYFVVTDWEGEIFMVNPDNTLISLLRTKEQGVNSADIEYVPEMNLLLVPTFFRNQVVAYRLSEKL